MTSNEDQRKQSLVESLLHSLYEVDQEQARSLVAAGMKRLDDDGQRITASDTESVHKSRHSRYFSRWVTFGLATAVVILIAISITMMDTSRSAMAAIRLSLDTALQDVGRHYSVTVVDRLSKDDVMNRRVDLYVKGGNQFALCAQQSLRQVVPVWLGSNQDYSWVVPPIGPVLEGNRRSLTQWFDQQHEVSTPYLHITTALEILQRRYQVQTLADEEVVFDDRAIGCRHVIGFRKKNLGDLTPATSPPDKIELWASHETGVAMKILVTWDLADDRQGRESATILLVEEVELADEFFTPEAHGAADRIRLNFSTEKRNSN